jgi:hypothetical protein
MTELPEGFDIEGFMMRLNRDIMELWNVHQMPYPLRLLVGRLKKSMRGAQIVEWIMENYGKLGYTIVMSRQAGRYIFLSSEWEKMDDINRNKFYRMGRRFYKRADPNPSDLRRAEIVLAHKITAEADHPYSQFIKPEVKRIIALAEDRGDLDDDPKAPLTSFFTEEKKPE